MEIWFHLNKVEKTYEDLEEIYTFLCRRMQDLEEINAGIWSYMGMEGMEKEKKEMEDIIIRMEKNIRYLDQLLRALEKAMQKYRNYEEKIVEKTDASLCPVQRWENVTYSDLGDIKSLLKNMLS